MKTLLLLAFFILFVHADSISQISSIGQKADTYILEKIKQYQIPGISIAVIKNNITIKKSSYGFSNLDNKVPVTDKTVFPIASMDKQITATCIMILYEKGKLKLTDFITQYFDSTPATWNKIQIKHLLSHTSGLPDEVTENYKGRSLINYSTAEILDHIKRQELLFTPGESFTYSDAGFVLLQLIVEKVSGQQYDNFLRQNILQPLGMTHTQTLDPTQIVSNRATSYYRNKEGKMFVNTWRHVDFGPLFNDIGTNIDDFIKYDVAINTFKLLKKETYDIMWAPFVLNNGRSPSNLVHEHKLFYAEATYGYAWEIENFKHHRIIYHGGFTGTSITKFPDDSLTIILFSNLTDRAGFNPSVMARHIAALYIPVSSFNYITEIKDPDTVTTLFLKEQINKLSAATIDNNVFTNNFLKDLTPALPAFRESIQILGSLNSLEFLDREKQMNNSMKIFYKANYMNGVLYYQVSMTKEGKIDLISIER